MLIFLILSIYIHNNKYEWRRQAKHDVIEAGFYDGEYVYGGKINTLKHAKQINKNIIKDDIKEFIKFHLVTRKDIVITMHLLLIFQGKNLWWM